MNQNAFDQQRDFFEPQNMNSTGSTLEQESAQESPQVVDLKFDEQKDIGMLQNVRYTASTPARTLAEDPAPVVEPKSESVETTEVPAEKPSYKPRADSKPAPEPSSYSAQSIEGKGSLSSKISKKNRTIDFHKEHMEHQNRIITVKNLHFQGLTVYSEEEVRNLFQPVLKGPTSFHEFIKHCETLIHKYWEDGYVLAEAEIKYNEYDPTSGDITVHLYEGKVKRTTIHGGDEGIRALISNYVTLVEHMQPFRAEAFEHYNSLTSYIPGLTIWGRTRPVENEPGIGNLDLTVNQKRLMPYFSIDNRGSKFVGPYRGMVGAYAMSMIKKGDVTNITFVGTPSKELAYGRMSYVFPLNYKGDSIYFRADYGKVQPGFIVKGDNIVEHDLTLEALYQHVSYALQNHQIILKAGMDAFQSDAITPNSRLYADQIREVILGIGDSFIDGMGGRNLTELRFYKGIRELGGANRAVQYRSETDGLATAARVLGEWTHSQSFTHNIAAVLSARGQFAFQSVLAPTAFYFGSYPYGSAYDPGEISGDSGLAGRLEGRYNFDTEGNTLNRAHAYLFYDGGKVWNRHISSGYLGKSGTSAGGGVRLMLFKNYETDFELAKPLTMKLRSVLANGTSRPWRFFFRVSGHF
jgi:hemolysin activation/secretion protein